MEVGTSSHQELKQEEESIPWYKSWKAWLKILIVVVVLTFLVLAIIFNKTTSKLLKGFLNWMQDNAAAGSFAFMVLYWFCTVMFIPGSLLTLGAGVVFRVVAGPWGGLFLATLVVFLGASAGASTAFVLGRFVFRDKVASYKSKYQKFDVIDKVVEEQGLKVTFLLRLSPIIPFSAFNYFMGLTSVSFKHYNLAHFGMIPGTIAYCFIGGTLGAIGESVGLLDPTVLAFTIGGTILAVAGMVYISIIAKREFNKIAEKHAEIGNDDVEQALSDDAEDNEAEQETANDPEIETL